MILNVNLYKTAQNRRSVNKCIMAFPDLCCLSEKIPHLSHHRWNCLCTKEFRKGGDYFHPSHIPHSSLPSHQCSIMLTHRQTFRTHGRDMWGMTWEMKGEIKKVKSLYLEPTEKVRNVKWVNSWLGWQGYWKMSNCYITLTSKTCISHWFLVP